MTTPTVCWLPALIVNDQRFLTRDPCRRITGSETTAVPYCQDVSTLVAVVSLVETCLPLVCCDVSHVPTKPCKKRQRKRMHNMRRMYLAIHMQAHVDTYIVDYLRVLFVKAHCTVERRVEWQIPVSHALVKAVHEETELTRGCAYLHCVSLE